MWVLIKIFKLEYCVFIVCVHLLLSTHTQVHLLTRHTKHILAMALLLNAQIENSFGRL